MQVLSVSNDNSCFLDDDDDDDDDDDGWRKKGKVLKIFDLENMNIHTYRYNL